MGEGREEGLGVDRGGRGREDWLGVDRGGEEEWRG